MMNRKRDGFTLLEVLIAMVILAIAFATAYLSLGSSARSLLRLQDKTAAQWVAMNVVARVQTELLALPNNASTSGNDVMFNLTWKWTLSVFPTEAPNIFRITVDVSSPTTDAVITHVTSYIFKK